MSTKTHLVSFLRNHMIPCVFVRALGILAAFSCNRQNIGRGRPFLIYYWPLHRKENQKSFAASRKGKDLAQVAIVNGRGIATWPPEPGLEIHVCFTVIENEDRNCDREHEFHILTWFLLVLARIKSVFRARTGTDIER